MDAREETSLFFEVEPDGSPLAPSTTAQTSGQAGTAARGHVHAVLPTKLRTPIGAHWQGGWLLSVDRQDVQDGLSACAGVAHVAVS